MRVGRSSLIHHRDCRCVWACLLLVFGLTAATFGDLPTDIVTSADPSQQKPTIDAFVDTNVTALSDPDPSKWAAARSALIAPLTKPGVTPGFLDVYADSVNTKLLVMLKS